jgi:hypothetical protein
MIILSICFTSWSIALVLDLQERVELFRFAWAECFGGWFEHVCVCVCVFMIRTPSTNTWSNTSRNLKCGLMKGNYFLCRPTGWVKFSFQAIRREEALALRTFSFIQLSPSQCTSIWSSIMHRRPRVLVSEVVSLQGGHPFKMWHKTVLIQYVHFQGNLTL